MHHFVTKPVRKFVHFLHENCPFQRFLQLFFFIKSCTNVTITPADAVLVYWMTCPASQAVKLRVSPNALYFGNQQIWQKVFGWRTKTLPQYWDFQNIACWEKKERRKNKMKTRRTGKMEIWIWFEAGSVKLEERVPQKERELWKVKNQKLGRNYNVRTFQR